MSVVDWLVTGLVVGLIAGELWWYLGPKRRITRVAPSRGVQEIRVVVSGGYHPEVVTVEAGRPVRLLFAREETAACSERVVLPAAGIERELPPFETVPVQFTPTEAGEYVFHDGHHLLLGRVVAEIGRDGARANLGKGHAKHG